MKMMVASEVRTMKVESFVLFELQQCGHVNFEYDCFVGGWSAIIIQLEKKEVGIVVNWN